MFFPGSPWIHREQTRIQSHGTVDYACRLGSTAIPRSIDVLAADTTANTSLAWYPSASGGVPCSMDSRKCESSSR